MGQTLSASTIERLYPGVKVPLKLPTTENHIAYGTAGFRGNSDVLDTILFRMGMLAALRSLKTGMAIGIVVTASHNPAQDNGVKIVDPHGGMLDRSWEEAAEQLANAIPSRLSAVIASISARENITLPKVPNTVSTRSLSSSLTPITRSLSSTSDTRPQFVNENVRVLIARDTRVSGERLVELAMEGVRLLGGTPIDMGLLTTPQLHHSVRMVNKQQGSGAYWGKDEWLGETGYYKMLADAYSELAETAEESSVRRNSLNWFGMGSSIDTPQSLIVDAANGIGASKVLKLQEVIHTLTKQLDIEVRNDGEGDGELNHLCGAEHAQKLQQPPINFISGKDNGKRCCSLDGDADRVVYHFFDHNGKWNLLDGDKMAALVATFLQDELTASGLSRRLSFAVVQTAYANGAATAFMKGSGIKVVTAATGVKFLHHEALQYDIGVYFEANGHGTVLFKDAAVHALISRELELVGVEAPSEDEPSLEKKLFQFGKLFRARRESEEERLAEVAQLARKRKALAVKRLLHVRQLVNQAVGDAFSDILLTEAILRIKRWSLIDWNAMYSELPSRQAKIRVKDRNVVRCTSDERRALSPPGLQAQLQHASLQFNPRGRCFVRPSGTEDAVRIYAEAGSQQDADDLALLAMKAVYDFAGGIGEPPTTAIPPNSH